MSLRDRFRPAGDAFLAPKSVGPSEAEAAQALSARRGRMTVAPPPSANKSIAALLRPLLPKQSAGLADLVKHWPEIICFPFAESTLPIKLTKGVLTLRVTRSSALMVQHAEELIVQRVANAGVKVTKIRIEQGSITPAPKQPPNVGPVQTPLSTAEEAALAQALDPACDPSLRSALLRLGRAVKQG